MYQLTTGCMYSSLFLCKPCGESYWIIGTAVDISIVRWFLFFPISFRSHVFVFFVFFLTGQPSSHSIKPARWPVVITTFQAACSSPGSATIRAGSPPTRPASTSGTPCRTCSHTVPTLQFSSLTCK